MGPDPRRRKSHSPVVVLRCAAVVLAALFMVSLSSCGGGGGPSPAERSLVTHFTVVAGAKDATVDCPSYKASAGESFTCQANVTAKSGQKHSFPIHVTLHGQGTLHYAYKLRTGSITYKIAGNISHGWSQNSPSASSASSASPTSGTSSPTQAQGNHVGSTYTINADGSKYNVTLEKVVQQATPGSEFETPGANNHLAAAEFRITAATKMDENANANATAVGSNGHTYDSSFESVAEGTNFDSGNVKLHSGASATGWVTFKLPKGVTITKVVWTASAGFGSKSQWLVP